MYALLSNICSCLYIFIIYSHGGQSTFMEVPISQLTRLFGWLELEFQRTMPGHFLSNVQYQDSSHIAIQTQVFHTSTVLDL